jgi:hypothetical protein
LGLLLGCWDVTYVYIWYNKQLCKQVYLSHIVENYPLYRRYILNIIVMKGNVAWKCSRSVLSNVLMYSDTNHWCLWRCGRHHTTTTIATSTVPCFKEILWKYLTILRRSKMSLVLQFELILKIGSIICVYGGRQENISRAPCWTGLV